MTNQMLARTINYSQLTAKDVERFFRFVDFGDCWIWTGGKTNGYGQFSFNNTNYFAHRFSYFLRHDVFQDPIKTIDHLCRNPACVNPSHLEFVPRGVNTLRSNSPSALNKVKTHCLRGHEFALNNTGSDTRGDRYCKTCRADNTRRWRKANFKKYTECNRANNKRTKLKALGLLQT